MKTHDTWILTQDGFDIRTAQASEGLFSLGSGYLHTRASMEEHFGDCPQDSRELRKPANVTAEKFRPVPGRSFLSPVANEGVVASQGERNQLEP